MMFRWSAKEVSDCLAAEDFDHAVTVENGDAILFDGMSLTHMADGLQPHTVPVWWEEESERKLLGATASLASQRRCYWVLLLVAG